VDTKTGGLRIAIIGARGIPARYGGFETVAAELAPRLVQRGHQVTVYCRTRYSLGSRPHYYSGVRLIYLPALYLKSLESLSNEAFAGLHAAFHGYDIVYVLGFRASFVHLASRWAGKVVVMNTDGFEWRRRKWGKLGRRYLRFSESIGARYVASSLICDSRALQPYYVERYRRQSTFIGYGTRLEPSGAPTVLERHGLKERDYFLVVARIEPENNIDVVIKEFQTVDTSKRLVIAGGSTYGSKYWKALRASGDPRVCFVGGVYEPGHIEALYRNAFAYVHGHEVGGTNPALVQAMGAGCCVLALDVPFNLEVVGNAGLLWNKEPGSLASQLKGVLAEPARAEGLRFAAKQRAEQRHSWEDIASEYDRFFRNSATHKRVPMPTPQNAVIPTDRVG
jgi:glycosyltransferase involved in cell wall biosynthesis